MTAKRDFDFAGSVVLGMHDALVSLMGLIVGLTVAMADCYTIILTSIIASITASLSMAASNYLAMRAGHSKYAVASALYTGVAYMVTCVGLILPFFVFDNRWVSLVAMFAIAVVQIFGFNYYLGHRRHAPYVHNFLEMLMVCAGVSVAAFLIGVFAQRCLGIQI